MALILTAQEPCKDWDIRGKLRFQLTYLTCQSWWLSKSLPLFLRDFRNRSLHWSKVEAARLKEPSFASTGKISSSFKKSLLTPRCLAQSFCRSVVSQSEWWRAGSTLRQPKLFACPFSQKLSDLLTASLSFQVVVSRSCESEVLVF